MGSRFSTTGTIEMASSKHSIKIEIVNRHGKDYVSVKDMEAVIAGRKKTATIWRPKPNLYKPGCRKKRED